MVLEALSGTEAPLRAQWLRAIALELERLANHSGDLGASRGTSRSCPPPRRAAGSAATS